MLFHYLNPLRMRLVATPNLNNDLDYSVLCKNSVLRESVVSDEHQVATIKLQQ